MMGKDWTLSKIMSMFFIGLYLVVLAPTLMDYIDELGFSGNIGILIGILPFLFIIVGIYQYIKYIKQFG